VAELQRGVSIRIQKDDARGRRAASLTVDGENLDQVAKGAVIAMFELNPSFRSAVGERYPRTLERVRQSVDRGGCFVGSEYDSNFDAGGHLLVTRVVGRKHLMADAVAEISCENAVTSMFSGEVEEDSGKIVRP